MVAAFKYAKEFENENFTAEFIPYSNHVDQNTVKLTGGDYIQTIRLQGAAHESADLDDINVWHNQLNNFFRNINSQIDVAVWSHIVRREYCEYPGGDFPPGFCKDFNEKYRAHIAGKKMLVNELYLTIVYRSKTNPLAKWIDKFQPKSRKERQEIQLEEIEAITNCMASALTALDRYEPQLLGCYEHKGNMFSEVLEFLAFLVNGEWRRFPLPRAEINQVLATSRPFFGKGGLMSLKGPTRTQYCAAVAITEYPSQTNSGFINELLELPFEFTLSQSFTFIQKHTAIGEMKRQQSRMSNSRDVAVSQVADIDDALDALASGHNVMGIHSLSLFIRSDDQKSLNDFIGLAGDALSDAGMKWGREDIGIAAAFWAQLPGNFKYRPRCSAITSLNFCGFSSLHNFPMGRIKGNQWGDAVTMFKTTSGAPFYFNFHKGESGSSKFDPNHKDLANTVVIGKSGTGKTVLQMVLLAQVQKFHRPEEGKSLSCVLFDKDLGASVGVRAMGGRYYPLKNGIASGFNPFQMDPTPNNLTFLEVLVKQLVKRDEMPLTPRQEREISQAIAGVMSDKVDKSKRRLSSILEFLDPSDENGIHIRLSRWCRGGALSWLFDNPVDTLKLDDCTMVGFDVTEFLDNKETRTPTIMYLFHRIESLIDGRRIPIFMDEFWKLLNDEAFEDLAQNKLVTIRKQDGFLVMFTQNPRQVLSSPIAHAIIGQTATKIFLPNPEADESDYVDGFKLSYREFEIIKSLGEKSRQFLIKQGQNSVVAELDLRGFNDELAVLSGNTATSNLAERLVEQLGNNPAVWLPEFHRIRKGN